MTDAKRILALSLALLALMAQGLAPTAAAAAQARVLDPFANLPICSTDMGGSGRSDEAPVHHQGQGCGDCVVCAAPLLAVPPSPPGPTPFARARISTEAHAGLPPPPLPARRTAQARAPPSPV